MTPPPHTPPPLVVTSQTHPPLWLFQILIKQIESSDNIPTISSAISNLLSLTQDGPQLCSIIAKVTRAHARPAALGLEADGLKRNVIVTLLRRNSSFISAEE